MAGQASAHVQTVHNGTWEVHLPPGSRTWELHLPPGSHTGIVRECHCQLCGTVSSGDTPVPVGLVADPVADAVARRGWSVVSVPAEGRRPAYAFTVGLWHSFGSAETAVFGRDEAEMAGWLDMVGAEIGAGRVLHPGSGAPEPPEDRPAGDFLGPLGAYPRPALASWHRHLFGAALAFYRGQPVPMLQLVWPDDRGVLPWEPGCADECRAAQPRLWDRVTAAPAPAGWAFPVSPDTLVLTTKAIAFDGAAVAGVVHDEEGEWQFLDDPAVDMEDLTIVHLAHVVARRPELAAVGDLPPGFEAWLDAGGRWRRVELDDVVD